MKTHSANPAPSVVSIIVRSIFAQSTFSRDTWPYFQQIFFIQFIPGAGDEADGYEGFGDIPPSPGCTFPGFLDYSSYRHSMELTQLLLRAWIIE